MFALKYKSFAFGGMNAKNSCKFWTLKIRLECFVLFLNLYYMHKVLAKTNEFSAQRRSRSHDIWIDFVALHICLLINAPQTWIESFFRFIAVLQNANRANYIWGLGEISTDHL